MENESQEFSEFYTWFNTSSNMSFFTLIFLRVVFSHLFISFLSYYFKSGFIYILPTIHFSHVILHDSFICTLFVHEFF